MSARALFAKEVNMTVKGTTPNGFKYEYDNEKLANWEVMDWLTEIMELSDIPDDERSEDDTITLVRDMYAVIRFIFTRKQITAWKNTNRNEEGEVVAEHMWQDFNELFMSGEDKETKN